MPAKANSGVGEREPDRPTGRVGVGTGSVRRSTKERPSSNNQDAPTKARLGNRVLVSAALAETLDQSTIMLDLVGNDQLAGTLDQRSPDRPSDYLAKHPQFPFRAPCIAAPNKQ